MHLAGLATLQAPYDISYKLYVCLFLIVVGLSV